MHFRNWIVAAVAATACAAQGPTLSAKMARSHIGGTATVCGTVAAVRSGSSSRQPTLIDFDLPYPATDFLAVVPGLRRGKYGDIGIAWRGKWVCVTGQIKTYRGTPDVIVDDPTQVMLGSSMAPR